MAIPTTIVIDLPAIQNYNVAALRVASGCIASPAEADGDFPDVKPKHGGNDSVPGLMNCNALVMLLKHRRYVERGFHVSLWRSASMGLTALSGDSLTRSYDALRVGGAVVPRFFSHGGLKIGLEKALNNLREMQVGNARKYPQNGHILDSGLNYAI